MNKIRKAFYKNIPLYSFAKEMLFFRDIFKNPKFNSEKDIVICGIQRSGSTLLYNLVCKVVELKRKPGQGFFYYTHDYIEKFNQPNYFFVRKTHNYTVFLKKRVKNKTSIGFYSHRNLLDIIASHKQKGWISDIADFVENGSLDQKVSEALLYGRLKNLIIIPYHDLFFNKSEVVYKIAKHLNIDINASEVMQLVEETSIVKTKERMADLVFEEQGKMSINQDTGLHIDHIADPNPEKWKTVLTESEILLIKDSGTYKKYCKFFKYEI